MEVFLDQAVGRRRSEGHPAVHLRHGNFVGHRRKRDQHRVRRLHVEPGPVDGAGVEPCGRACLKATQRETEAVDGLSQCDRRRLPCPPLKGHSVTNKGFAAQEGAVVITSAGAESTPRSVVSPPSYRFVEDNVVSPSLDHGQPALCLQQGLDGLAVQASVGCDRGPGPPGP